MNVGPQHGGQRPSSLASEHRVVHQPKSVAQRTAQHGRPTNCSAVLSCYVSGQQYAEAKEQDGGKKMLCNAKQCKCGFSAGWTIGSKEAKVLARDLARGHKASKPDTDEVHQGEAIGEGKGAAECCPFWGLTFELRWRQRCGALDSKRRMGRRPSA